MDGIWSLALYGLPLVAILGAYLWRQRRIDARHRRVHEESVASGMTEPASLHPLIDASKCLGCGACVKACPEQPHHEVLGLINGKAVLVGPTDCIGHGACKIVCPFDAITMYALLPAPVYRYAITSGSYLASTSRSSWAWRTPRA